MWTGAGVHGAYIVSFLLVGSLRALFFAEIPINADETAVQLTLLGHGLIPVIVVGLIVGGSCISFEPFRQLIHN